MLSLEKVNTNEVMDDSAYRGTVGGSFATTLGKLRKYSTYVQAFMNRMHCINKEKNPTNDYRSSETIHSKTLILAKLVDLISSRRKPVKRTL